MTKRDQASDTGLCRIEVVNEGETLCIAGEVRKFVLIEWSAAGTWQDYSPLWQWMVIMGCNSFEGRNN